MTIPLLLEDQYKFNVNKLLDAITPEFSLIYLDNPNNPTGQNIALSEIRIILDKAKQFDICVILDEAYGDYVDSRESAVNLINEYDNLIVLRTFSKGLGLAGARSGYMLASEDLCSQFDKLSNPYKISQLSRLLSEEVLKDSSYIEYCRKEFVFIKSEIRKHTGKLLHMAYTLDACPIMLIWHDLNDIDLAKEFAKYGVKVYSGYDFETLGINSVRLRAPKRDSLEFLLEVLDKING